MVIKGGGAKAKSPESLVIRVVKCQRGESRMRRGMYRSCTSPDGGRQGELRQVAIRPLVQADAHRERLRAHEQD